MEGLQGLAGAGVKLKFPQLPQPAVLVLSVANHRVEVADEVAQPIHQRGRCARSAGYVRR
jgi:hypothetical protein